MSGFRLYHSPASPFVRKVMVVLLETGQADDVTLVFATGTPVAPGSLPVAQNPLGKIPALERPEGCTLYDSRVICRFFDDRAGAGLYPPGARGWETLTLEATADGMMEAAVLMRYEQVVRPPEMVSADWMGAQWGKVERALDALEARWQSHLAGPLDMGQVALGAALGYLDFRFADREWRRGRDGLAAWESSFAGRESMQATRPE